MGFLLLLITTVLLFNRPGDWMPAVADFPLFQLTIAACLAASINQCSATLNSLSLRTAPITVCVVGLLGVSALSSLMSPHSSFDTIIYFGKACVLYLLIVAIVNSPTRARTFFNVTGGSIFFVGLLIVVNQHTDFLGYSQKIGGSEGYLRAEALGGRNFDANDTAALLVIAIMIFLSNVVEASTFSRRVPWIVGLAISMYSLKLTNSRAGFLALIVAVATYLAIRWGRKGLKWALLVIPVAAAIIATDRMTDFSAVQTGTGQNRLQFSLIGLSKFFNNPLFGIGPGAYVVRIGKACHNSFVQGFAEIGFLGGALFVGAFYLSARSAYQIARAQGRGELVAPELTAAIYALPAIFAGYGVSLLTLNHLFASHTYLLFGFASTMSCLFQVEEAREVIAIERNLPMKLVAVSCGFIFFMYAACQVLVHW